MKERAYFVLLEILVHAWGLWQHGGNLCLKSSYLMAGRSKERDRK